MRKLLFLLILSPVILIASLFFAEKLNTEDPIYLVSESSFEHASESEAYYEEQNASIAYSESASKLLGYVWTKTGKLINVLRELCNLPFEKSSKTSPLAQASSTSYQFLKAGNETIYTIFKTLGPGQEILHAAHHPWIFLLTLYFGTILLSLWFLRLSTGVSPPGLNLRLLGNALRI